MCILASSMNIPDRVRVFEFCRLAAPKQNYSIASSSNSINAVLSIASTTFVTRSLLYPPKNTVNCPWNLLDSSIFLKALSLEINLDFYFSDGFCFSTSTDEAVALVSLKTIFFLFTTEALEWRFFLSIIFSLIFCLYLLIVLLPSTSIFFLFNDEMNMHLISLGWLKKII